MISILQVSDTPKPHLYFDSRTGYWRVTRPAAGALFGRPEWRVVEALGKRWNTYRGYHNREARLLSAWGSRV